MKTQEDKGVLERNKNISAVRGGQGKLMDKVKWTSYIPWPRCKSRVPAARRCPRSSAFLNLLHRQHSAKFSTWLACPWQGTDLDTLPGYVWTVGDGGQPPVSGWLLGEGLLAFLQEGEWFFAS